MSMQNFTALSDVPSVEDLLRTALAAKQQPLADRMLGDGKTMGVLFLNPSLRTRISTQRAAQNLGMQTIVMNMNGEGWQLEFADGTVMDGGKAEHVKDAVGVMGRYFDIIGIRSFPTLEDREADYADRVLSQFKKYAGIPVVSLESAIRHPLQSLADLMTITEHRKRTRPKVVLTWAPHPRPLPQAVANSFVEWMRAADVDFTIAHPEGYGLAPEFTAGVNATHDQRAAFESADFVYAKNWSSYQDYGRILRNDLDWLVTPEKMTLTNNGHFMHCLPVRRNVVVADAVIDHPNSLVLEQAENRVYAAQAVLKMLLQAKKGA